MTGPPAYPLALAVEDFVPVLLTTAGVITLRRFGEPGDAATAGRGRLGHRSGALIVLAGVLIGLGGLGKAGWKLIVALGGPDLPWLENLLFPLLTLGFGLLCLVLATARSGTTPRWLAWLVPLLTLACAAGALAAGRTIPLLVSTTVFCTIGGVYLILAALDRGDTLSAGLIGVQLLGFFVLSPLAARPDQSVTLQWVEQLCNTAAQAAFLAASVRLARVGRTGTQPEEVA